MSGLRDYDPLENRILQQIRGFGLSQDGAQFILAALHPAGNVLSPGIPDCDGTATVRPSYDISGTFTYLGEEPLWDALVVSFPGALNPVFVVIASAGTDFSSGSAPEDGYGAVYVLSNGTGANMQVEAVTCTTGATVNLNRVMPDDDAMMWRTASRSVTVDLNAAAIGNQGAVWSCQLGRDPVYQPLMDALTIDVDGRPVTRGTKPGKGFPPPRPAPPPPRDEDEFVGRPRRPKPTEGAHSASRRRLGSTLYYVGSALFYSFPDNESEMSMLSKSTGMWAAQDGVYIPCRLNGPTQPWVAPSSQTCFTDPGSAIQLIAGSMPYIPTPMQTYTSDIPWWVQPANLAATTGPYEWNLAGELGFDNSAVGVAVFRGLAAGATPASITVRSRMTLERVVHSQSDQRPFVKAPCAPDDRAIALYYQLLRDMPTSFPSSANFLGAILPFIARAARFLWPVVKAALPTIGAVAVSAVDRAMEEKQAVKNLKVSRGRPSTATEIRATPIGENTVRGSTVKKALVPMRGPAPGPGAGVPRRTQPKRRITYARKN